MDFDCRFTDRTLTLAAHGSGLKLTITKHYPDQKLYPDEAIDTRTSVFLDLDTARAFSYRLRELGFGVSGRPAAPAKLDLNPLADAIKAQAWALIDIANTIQEG